MLDTCKHLEKLGGKVTYLPVDGRGTYQPGRPRSRHDARRLFLVTIMYGNNETGTIQPIREIAAIAHRHGALFMS